ncbi:MAG: tRNA (N6-isopentenyl adenosine(37)-C2)-methylthiotransferase MiaB [Solobacterium sp.]|nr:tRNA (N6-isopentenyl adenosine(37)-C2)-methylthiotransferase MiaB [Solobacterium sp.]
MNKNISVHIKNQPLVGTIERDSFLFQEEFMQLGIGKTYCVLNYGCQANVRDGETLSGMLEMMSFQKVDKIEEADVVIFNTCAVRQTAEEHVFGKLSAYKSYKENHPGRIFALCGCMAQEENVIERLLKKHPYVDLIFGTHNIDRFPQLLQRVYEEKQTIVEVEAKPGGVIENLPVERSSSYKAFVNIMYGCNKFCTYCIVPYTRGRERSRLKENIIEEIRTFQAQGGKEVTLLGQNVNAYGKDLKLEDGFTDLLIDCAKTGVDRIRFYTSHPKDYSVTTIEAMRDYPNIMKSLHLPVQSGNNEILRRMGRGYTIEHYFQLFDDLKARIPEITFTTDIIVGFPGETDEQFEDTLKLVDHCKFDLAYTFVYSPREGTPAAKMPDDIPLSVKKERLQTLNARISSYAKANNETYVGKTLEVLCEGPSKKNLAILSGYSKENKLVNFKGENIQAGELVNVEITDAKSYTLDGQAV